MRCSRSARRNSKRHDVANEDYGRFRIEATKLGARLFRNNVGLFKTADGRKIKTGLCNGSSDLIGWTPVTITPSMVGQTVAIFLAVEVKSATGELEPDQKDFIRSVRSAGGIAGVAVSPEELAFILQRQ